MSDLLNRIQQALEGRYEIEREIGRGGMGIVYLATDLKLKRQVAIKVLRPELAQAVGAERFLREVRIEASLDHPNIVALFDSGEADGLPYYVMPYVKGESLRKLIEREERLSLDEVVRITNAVAAGLSHAHANGVIHRDIKPENILLTDDRVLIADFGIAKATEEAGGEKLSTYGLVLGTPEYMSPEQAMDDKVDHRTDIYALGCVVYEMLSGDPPFMGRTRSAIIAKHVKERATSLDIVRVDTPYRMVQAVAKALSKVAADRFDSTTDFAAALEKGRASGAPGLAVQAWRNAVHVFRQHKAVGTLVMATAVGVVGVTGYMVWHDLTNRPLQLNDRRIVVFPLSAASAGEDWAVRGWEAALAIEEALERTEPLKWLDGWSYLPESTRAEPRLLTRDAALNITRAAGARYYITGAMRGDSAPTVTLWLYDALADTLVAPATHAGGVESVARVALGAMEPLLGKLVEPGRQVDLSPLTERSNRAIALTFQGDQAYRQAQFLEALDFYKRAVAEDSLSALSAVKGAQAASWAARTEQDGQPLLHAALRADYLLPPKYRAFVHGLGAYYAGEADSAIASFNEALRLDAEWSEAWTALGDVYYNLLPSVTSQDSLAEQAFRRAAVSDSLFAPPLVKLAEISARRGDLDSTRALVARFRRIGTDSTYARELGFLQGCLERGPEAMAEAELGDSVGVTIAAMHLASGGARMDCAEAGYRRMLAVADLPAAHWRGIVLGLSGVLMAEGRYPELSAFLDSVVAAGYRGAMSLYLLFEALGAPQMQGAADAEGLARELTGELYERAQPDNRWLLGLWQLRAGNLGKAAAIVESMDRVADSTGASADRLFAAALAAHVAIAQGDTAAALGHFKGLRADFPSRRLMWEPACTLAPTRLLQAEVLLQQDRRDEADSVVAKLDEVPILALLPALPSALSLRARIADRAGRPDRVRDFEERIFRLTGSRMN